jgi:hypothetical protein
MKVRSAFDDSRDDDVATGSGDRVGDARRKDALDETTKGNELEKTEFKKNKSPQNYNAKPH